MSKESLKRGAIETSKNVLRETTHFGVSVGLGAAAGKVIETVAIAEGIKAAGIAIDVFSGGMTLGAGTALGALVGGIYYLRNRTRRQTTVHEGNPNRPVVTKNHTVISNPAETLRWLSERQNTVRDVVQAPFIRTN